MLIRQRESALEGGGLAAKTKGVKMAGETEKMAPFETANFRQVRVKFVNSQTKVKKK